MIEKALYAKRPNHVELPDGSYLLRTQAGFNRVIKKIKKEGATHDLLYPGAYPCVMKIYRKYEGANYYSFRFLKLETALNEIKLATIKERKRISRLDRAANIIKKN